MPTLLWIVLAAICFKIGLPVFGWIIIALLFFALLLLLIE